MKSSLLSLFAVFLFLTCFQVTHAAFNVDCSNTGALESLQNPYENIYHEGMDDWVIAKSHQLCQGEYESNCIDDDFDYTPCKHKYLVGVFPIYVRTSNIPFLIQSVINEDEQFKQMLSVPYSQFLRKPWRYGWSDLIWSDGRCGRYRFTYNWTPWSCYSRMSSPSEDRKNIYLLSQQAPYKSAPQIQFYTYHLHILLVARNTQGEITHFAYEDSKHQPSEKAIKRFLGDKWFHP